MSRCRTALKLKVAGAGAGAGAAARSGTDAAGVRLAIGVNPEEDLCVFHGVGIAHGDLAHDTRVLGLDLVHDLHGLDDAEYLPLLDARALHHVRWRSRLRRAVEGAN